MGSHSGWGWGGERVPSRDDCVIAGNGCGSINHWNQAVTSRARKICDLKVDILVNAVLCVFTFIKSWSQLLKFDKG